MVIHFDKSLSLTHHILIFFLLRDVWNEPDNSGYTSELISPLISQVFSWCREARPSQPLTTPLWHGCMYCHNWKPSELESIQIEQSDIISFHNYASSVELQRTVDALLTYGIIIFFAFTLCVVFCFVFCFHSFIIIIIIKGKPVVCTEYMAREAGSFFNPHMGIMKSRNVAAFNWGLVSGRTNTIYPWCAALLMHCEFNFVVNYLLSFLTI